MGSSVGNVFVLAVFVSAFFQSVMGETFMVGDKTGWTFPPDNANTFYDSWAKANGPFHVNDVLFFQYDSSEHNVYEVSAADLSTCSTASPIQTWLGSNASVTLTAGSHSYICAYAGHCSGGMKFSLTVAAATTPSAAPVASPPTPTASPPTPVASPPTPTASPPTPVASPTTPISSPPTPAPSAVPTRAPASVPASVPTIPAPAPASTKPPATVPVSTPVLSPPSVPPTVSVPVSSPEESPMTLAPGPSPSEPGAGSVAILSGSLAIAAISAVCAAFFL